MFIWLAPRVIWPFMLATQKSQFRHCLFFCYEWRNQFEIKGRDGICLDKCYIMITCVPRAFQRLSISSNAALLKGLFHQKEEPAQYREEKEFAHRN